MLYGLLQLPALLEHISQIGVGLSQHWVLFNGQGTEVRRPVGQEWKWDSHNPDGSGGGKKRDCNKMTGVKERFVLHNRVFRWHVAKQSSHQCQGA